ncbi:MAG TPA: hypothetical protein VK206_01120, partial [Anaerolineales bacterium]|nr:hypothetical protein [Anaerolineales bacterium]
FDGCGTSNPIQLFPQTILQKSPSAGPFAAKRTFFYVSHYCIIRFALYISHYFGIIQRRRSNTLHKLPFIGLAMATSDLE